MFASLPWYDIPEIEWANNALWAQVHACLRRHGVPAPGMLDRTTPYERQWTSGELLLGQACGYDVILSYAGDLQPIAVPAYGAPNCTTSTYHSLIVVHETSPAKALSDLRGKRCVFNTPTSHSGVNVLRALVAPMSVNGRFFSSVQKSGAHDRSLSFIRGGRADVAAIDCITWDILRRHRPSALDGLRVLSVTKSTMAPPFVTSSAASPTLVSILQRALQEAIEAPTLKSALDAIGLKGLAPVQRDAYAPMREDVRVATTIGYHELSPSC